MTVLDMPMGDEPPRHNEGETRFDFGALLRKFVIGIPIMLGGALLGTYVSVLVLRSLQPRYTSSVSLLIDPKRPGSFGAESEFGNTVVDSSKIANVELILLSSDVLGRVVQKDHLAARPEFGDASPSLLERYFPSSPERAPAATLDTSELRTERAIDRLRLMVKTSRIDMTYVVKLDVSASSAAQAQRLAGEIADSYLAEQMQAKLDATQRDTAWLTDRIRDQRDALTRSSAQVETLRRKLGVTSGDATSDTTVDRDSIKQINIELARAEADLAAAQARYEQADRLARDGGGLEGLSQVTASGVISDLRKQQAEASERLANLSVRYGSDYPARRQAEHDIAALNSQVTLEVSRIVAGLRNDYQTALTHRDVLKAQLTGLVGAVTAAVNAEGRVQLREAEHVADADRAAYEASLGQLRDVEPQQTRQEVEARIISEPDLAERPSFPKPIIFLPAGGVLGFVVGAAIALALPGRRSRAAEASEAERELALPVLATIPYLSKAELREAGGGRSIPNYLMMNPFSSFGDSLRLLRLRLSKAGPIGNQVIQITSAVQGEGKSTVAASLAISAASAGIKTVLVDLDLYHPESAHLLEFNASAGVVDVLTGSVEATSALRTYKDLPLRVITAGGVRNLRPTMIEGSQLRELIAELRQEFDFIVLDTPPVLAICDSLYISSLADTTVMVAAWRTTPQESVAEAVRSLRAVHAPIVGLLFNKVNYTRNAKYGGYYYGERRQIAA